MNRQYSLKKCQQLFLSAVLDDNNIYQEVTSLKKITANNSQKADLLSLVSPSIKKTEGRISVYKNNYQMTLYNCLKNTFIKTYEITGHNRFKELAISYIKINPSLSEDLNHYGQQFPDFLASLSIEKDNGLLTSHQGTALYYVAQYDYLKQSCYYALNNQSMPINYFINLSIDMQMQTLFVRQPSLKILASPIKLTELNSFSNLDDLMHQKNMGHYLLFRNEGKVQVKELAKPLFDLLKIFKQPSNMNALNENQIEQLPILLREGWLRLADDIL